MSHKVIYLPATSAITDQKKSPHAGNRLSLPLNKNPTVHYYEPNSHRRLRQNLPITDWRTLQTPQLSTAVGPYKPTKKRRDNSITLALSSLPLPHPPKNPLPKLFFPKFHPRSSLISPNSWLNFGSHCSRYFSVIFLMHIRLCLVKNLWCRGSEVGVEYYWWFDQCICLFCPVVFLNLWGQFLWLECNCVFGLTLYWSRIIQLF